MSYVAAGRITESRCREGEALRLRFAFVCDGSGNTAIRQLDERLDMLLERVVFYDATVTGSQWDVYLYDEYDSDVLAGAGAALAVGIATEKIIGADLGSNRRGRVQTMGDHWLHITGTGAAAQGFIDLYCVCPKGVI